MPIIALVCSIGKVVCSDWFSENMKREGKMIGERDRKRSWTNIWVLLFIFLQKLRKSLKILSLVNLQLDLDSKPFLSPSKNNRCLSA